MKLTQRQKHVLGYCLASVLIWTFTLSGMLFMKSGPEDITFMVPTFQEGLTFFRHALPLTIPFGLVTGIFFSLASMPNKPVTQIHLETLRERVCDYLRETDPKTNELVLIFEWAGRLGWKGVEANVRRNPEKWPHAAALLAQDAEIIPFRKEG